MASKNSFISNVFCKELNTDVKWFFSKQNLDALRSSTHKGRVLQGMEYRPDKVAAYYLGDENGSWLITLTNGFVNGVADYTLGREILIPNEEAIIKLEPDTSK